VPAAGHRWIIDVALARESWREGVTANGVAPGTASRRGVEALSQRAGHRAGSARALEEELPGDWSNELGAC